MLGGRVPSADSRHTLSLRCEGTTEAIRGGVTDSVIVLQGRGRSRQLQFVYIAICAFLLYFLSKADLVYVCFSSAYVSVSF